MSRERFLRIYTNLSIVIGFIIYSYLLYQQKRWDLVRCDEYIEIPRWSNNLSFTFYIFLS